MSLRLCYTETSFLKWVPDSQNPAGGYFDGNMATIGNGYIRLLLWITPNLTVQSESLADVEQHLKKNVSGWLFGSTAAESVRSDRH